MSEEYAKTYRSIIDAIVKEEVKETLSLMPLSGTGFNTCQEYSAA